METHTNTEITNTEAKPNKRSFEECENEYIMHKIMRLDDMEVLSNCQGSSHLQCCNYEQFSDVNFNLELYLQNKPEPASIVIHDAIQPSVIKSKKTELTLIELAKICYDPIKKTNTKEDKMVEKEIEEIAKSLKCESNINLNKKLLEHNKNEAMLIENLKKLFNTLLFKNCVFSKDGFIQEEQTILYEQLCRVNVYIVRHTSKEIIIYFQFPFYLFIHIDPIGKITLFPNNIYNKLKKNNEIEKIQYQSSNTGYNTLDLITSTKFVRLILNNCFTSGFDLLNKLNYVVKVYKKNSSKLVYNKIHLNFEKFVNLYQKVIKIVSSSSN